VAGAAVFVGVHRGFAGRRGAVALLTALLTARE
jgi:hypothetical protein